MFSFTICQSADPNKPANKRIERTPFGVTKKDYGNAYRWYYQPMTRTTFASMVDILRRLACRPEAMIIIGAPKPALDLKHAHVRRWAEPIAVNNTLLAVDRAWIAIDCDDVTLPWGDGRAERLFHAGCHVRDRLLPKEFKWRDCVVVPTAMTGLVGENIGRLRLFFPLDRGYPATDLRRWARGAQIAGLPVDAATTLAGQPIYTARPTFIGMDDPVPAQLFAFLLPGFLDGPVPLRIGRFDEMVRVVTARILRVSQEVGSDWRAFLEHTVGPETGFFEPLTKGLGVAARSDASEAEIVAYVGGLLAERAKDDPGRRSRYGPRWVTSTVARFRRVDQRTDDEIERLQQRLFNRIA